MCSKKEILGVESCDFSQDEIEITACKAEQIHKMTTIFTKKWSLAVVLSENSCHFVNLLCLANNQKEEVIIRTVSV